MAKAKQTAAAQLEDCCCIWERPPRGRQNRERKLKERKPECKSHGEDAK